MKRRLVLRHPDGYWQFPSTRTKPLDQWWRWAAAVGIPVFLLWFGTRHGIIPFLLVTQA